jgi:hypothetical protein
MNKKLFAAVSIFAILSIFAIADAQMQTADDSFYMFGSFDSEIGKTGYFSKNPVENFKITWHVFVGQNGQVYKLSLIEKSVHELFIDGQKFADAEIFKHTAEFKPNLEKIWRDKELEQESEKIDAEAEQFDAKAEEIDKEIDKLDKAEEKLERLSDKISTDFTKERESLNAQRKRLSEIRENYSRQAESFGNRQEKINQEQESLDTKSDLDKVLRQIIIDLKTLHAVKNTEQMSFKLSSKELIVNGFNITNEMFDRLKSKYIIETAWETGFLYRWKPKV